MHVPTILDCIAIGGSVVSLGFAGFALYKVRDRAAYRSSAEIWESRRAREFKPKVDV